MSGATKQAQQDELIGQVINDRFRILSAIARGGMGKVYRAEQVPLGRLVAIKTLDPRQTGTEGDPQFQQRFFLEASVASKLQHPNTVTVFDYGRTSDGIFFIAMELVEGRSLLATVRDQTKLDPSRVVHISLQIARSLREAHRLDVIHRDLKPGNVLLTTHGDEEDFVKVLDFGLVKHVESEDQQELTKAGLFMGSPKYMSPEQIRGERVDARCDIYALGACMYEMLTGRVPFDRENTVKILMAHMHEAVPPIEDPSVPPALNDLVLRCLEKKPENRPASMDEVIMGLKHASGGPTMVSGAFPLSGEMRLSTSSSISRIGTPSQPFVAGTHPMSGTPSAAFQSPALSPTGGLQIPAGTPLGMPTHSQMPQAKGSGWLPKVVVVCALVVASGFLALKFSEQPKDGQVSAMPVTPTVARTEGPEPTVGAAPVIADEAEAQPRRMLLRLTSTPAGAIVHVGDKKYGPTPADIEWWGEDAAEGREVTFEFELEGHESTTVTRILRGKEVAIDAMLPHKQPIRRVRADRPKPKPKPTGPVVIPKSFKDDPY